MNYSLRSVAEETQPAPKMTVSIDAVTGKVQIAPLPEKQEVSAQSAPKPAAPVAEDTTAEKAEKSKILELQEEQAATEPSEDTAQITPGKEERTNYVHLPSSREFVFLDADNKCAFVVENGKYRECRYDDFLNQQ